MPRKTITDMIPDIEAPDQAPQAPGQPPAAEVPPAKQASAPKQPRRNRQAASAPAAGDPPARPSARDLAAPPRGQVTREALKVDVPAELALLHRLRRYRLDTGTDIRDQVAIAVDEWLTSQGY